MSVSRRRFIGDASALGLITALLPGLSVAQETAAQNSSAEEAPHDSYDFWNGFFDSVNPMSKNYGQKSATRGPKDQLPDPAAQTKPFGAPTGRPWSIFALMLALSVVAFSGWLALGVGDPPSRKLHVSLSLPDRTGSAV